MSRTQTPSGRVRISDENLHISSFALVRTEPDSILFVKASDSHPLSFRRGKLLLPATMLRFGERPMDAATRAVDTQLSGAGGVTPKFIDLQSYMGSHWDICFVYEFDLTGKTPPTAVAPYADAVSYKSSSLPRPQIAEDHLEVIDGLSRPPD
jgi:hypothetical protein